MKTDNVTNARKMKDGSIELAAANPLAREPNTTRRYADIRGGLVFPAEKTPAYLCIIGQEYIRPKIGQRNTPVGEWVLLAEYEASALAMDFFYEKLTNLSEQFMCRDFYADLPEKRYESGYLHDFDNFARERHSKACLQAAYDADDFMLGIGRLMSAINKQELSLASDSLVRSQLRGITEVDLHDKPAERYHTVNALRHVIGSFFRFPARIRPRHASRLQQRMSTGTSFMSA